MPTLAATTVGELFAAAVGQYATEIEGMYAES
jgi:hypothetical protein